MRGKPFRKIGQWRRGGVISCAHYTRADYLSYPLSMTAYDDIDRAFARACFRQAKQSMTFFVHHYRHTEKVTETTETTKTIETLERRIAWAATVKKTMPSLYTPQRILMLRAQRYVLRRRACGYVLDLKQTSP